MHEAGARRRTVSQRAEADRQAFEDGADSQACGRPGNIDQPVSIRYRVSIEQRYGHCAVEVDRGGRSAEQNLIEICAGLGAGVVDLEQEVRRAAGGETAQDGQDSGCAGAARLNRAVVEEGARTDVQRAGTADDTAGDIVEIGIGRDQRRTRTDIDIAALGGRGPQVERTGANLQAAVVGHETGQRGSSGPAFGDRARKIVG